MCDVITTLSSPEPQQIADSQETEGQTAEGGRDYNTRDYTPHHVTVTWRDTRGHQAPRDRRDQPRQRNSRGSRPRGRTPEHVVHTTQSRGGDRQSRDQ